MVYGTSNIDPREIEPRIWGPLTAKMLKGIVISIPLAVLVFFILDFYEADITTQLSAAAAAFLPGFFLTSSRMKMHGIPFSTYLRCRFKRTFLAPLKYTYSTDTGYTVPERQKTVKKSREYRIYR
jgi:hypothetical protein